MREYIHDKTIKNFFEQHFNEIVVDRRFENKKTKEVYHVLTGNETDIAFFTVGKEGEHICLNSDGEPVDPQQIFGYINGECVSGTYSCSLYRTDKLNLQYQGERISLNSLVEHEKDLYPKRTGITIPAILERKASHGEDIQDFLVDKVVKVRDEEFSEIISGMDSDYIRQYNQKEYDYVEGKYHGVMFINEQGDGVMVDPQGYNYARYMCFAPKIQEYVDKQFEQEMEQTAVLEMKLYVPIKVTKYDEEENEEVEVDGSSYYKDICASIQQESLINGKRGLAAYLHKKSCGEKVFAIKPDVECRNGQLMGVVNIKMTEPLNNLEMQELKDYCTGQFSDGWGESFEQREIDTLDGEIYVHFWNSQNYYIRTEAEMNQEQDMGMAGIQGM